MLTSIEFLIQIVHVDGILLSINHMVDMVIILCYYCCPESQYYDNTISVNDNAILTYFEYQLHNYYKKITNPD